MQPWDVGRSKVLLMRVLTIGSIPRFVGNEYISEFDAAGFRCSSESSVENGIELLSLYSYDLIIADLQSAGRLLMKASAESARLAKQSSLIVVTKFKDIALAPELLLAGADDVIAADFTDSRELVHRIRAIVRRARGHSNVQLDIGSISIDLMSREVQCGCRLLPLNRLEYEVFEHLALKAGKLVRKEAIMDYLYGGHDEPSNRIVDAIICKIRRKILEAGEQDAPIRTVRGQGYIIEVPGSVSRSVAA